MKTGYKVIRHDDLENLEQVVEMFMDKGWQPQGGLANDRNGYYLQAMTFEPRKD